MAEFVKKRIVVVGGGAAGASVVRNLSKKLDPSKHELVLITARPKYAYLPASLRVLVSRETPIDTVFMPYDTVFANFPGQLRIAVVSSVEVTKNGTGGQVIFKDGEQISYDILILATGSSWTGLVALPNEEALYKEHIETWRTKFEKAQDIVIVGGGSVGIEVAGEIKDVYPNKNVTIVQGQVQLLNGIYPYKFRKDIEQRLRKRGINFIFEDSIEGNPEYGPGKPLRTRNGVSLNCDLLVTARGAGPNTSLMRFVQPIPLNERGLIQVLPTLQVKNHPSIFAAGDIIDLAEAKQFAKTASHASVISANVVSYLKGEEPKKECKPGVEMIIISNGKNGGAAYFAILGGLQFGDFICRVVKSRDLMVGLVRHSLGLSTTAWAQDFLIGLFRRGMGLPGHI